jgi:predicted nucleotidyltransferase component of viral defense system
MLHLESIDDPTLALLRELMQRPSFSEFRLVGGTALALQYGHRKSIDLDLFGPTDFIEIDFQHELSTFATVTLLQNSKHIKSYVINDIKVDFVRYSYKWIGELLLIDTIRMADPTDIAAMKLSAITNRGTKKDFFDMYLLLKSFSLKNMLAFYHNKFADGNDFMVLKSITYFDDAEENEDPEILDGTTWQQVKQEILKAHQTFMDSL